MPGSSLEGRPFVRIRSVAIALFLAGVFIVGPGCSGPPVKPWHTEKLTSEFTTDKLDEIRTFEDYRRLEDDLFKELDEKVYSRVETGPGYELARYSPGSAAAPSIAVRPARLPGRRETARQ